ncbi:hypothetical protein OUZ56_012643 [Daphnia magna]|uniref:Uncharacterized protein n=1 Tax=Daphnia magna TaxID=35525 RepID=A0ABQ9Z3N4_9CRUS|nr:hypothetical protein OUZ56_012643 [Daphnia magna]
MKSLNANPLPVEITKTKQVGTQFEALHQLGHEYTYQPAPPLVPQQPQYQPSPMIEVPELFTDTTVDIFQTNLPVPHCLTRDKEMGHCRVKAAMTHFGLQSSG